MTSSNGYPPEDQEPKGDQVSPGGIPPSFGASSPPPPLPSSPPATPPPAPLPAISASPPESAAANLPATPENQPDATPELPVTAAAATSAVAFPPEPAPPEPAPSEPAPSEPAPPEPAPPEPVLPELAPESAEPTVGWYPSAPAGPPTAGPFARPSTPARRGLGALSYARVMRPSRPAGSAGSASRTPAWRNRRSRLVNVVLFGLGPLVLAGVVVAAFLLVAPGKGSASSLGFQAGPGATAQSSASASASPTAPPSSPAAHVKPHARPAPSSAVVKVPIISTAKPKTTPKPAHESSGGGGVTPHNLGLPNFAGYCHHIGDRTAELIASNAYGWRCTLNTSQALQINDVCAWTYQLSASQVVGVSANYGDPNAWQCWRINRDLGVLNVGNYCAAAGLGTSELVAENAYGWYCTSPAAPVNTTAACDTVYHVNDAVARFAVFADPYSWQCWD